MIAKFIGKSCSRFAIKIILAERSQLRCSQPRKAAKRWRSALNWRELHCKFIGEFSGEFSKEFSAHFHSASFI